MTLAQRLIQGTAILTAAGIEDPRREARLLLAYAAGLDMAGLLRCLTANVPVPLYEHMLERRAAREPIAFILGRQPFWNFEVAVTNDTLIPRADSETLIEAAVIAFPKRKVARVLDMGTGTGCLLIAALVEFPNATGVGMDRSADATALAWYNAETVGVAERAAFFCGDWGTALNGKFDLVLSNPPYIETAVIPGLMPEVALYEPASALDGGADGLVAYRAIMAGLPGLLAPGGVAILELGQGQAPAVAELATGAGLVPGPPHRDLGGVERALPIRRGGKKTFGEVWRGR
ncbi:peptide chain release factor N(5)-glutamine methyltransferase [Acidisphaera sp. L21]|uniref:peptide chain release factor N(5)-glutamine methyltransferase n=1 Tax=Acidisphaera sp. L21 TaxID=1641851 RepID=UPI00131B6283|nr:peptide chain release factor N(5)-glutamine methyltransferase [Acidisphaera sp. L21]